MRRILVTEAKLHLREWPSLLLAMALPVILLLVIGSISGMSAPDPKLGGESLTQTQLPAQMSLLAMMTMALTALPGILTTYRERGVLRRMSTTPVHPVRLLAAQLLINLVIGIVSVVVVIAVGRIVLGTAVPRQLAGFVLVFLLGSAALLAIGLVIAAVAPSSKVAPALGSLVMFPLMFVGGMWTPRELMPGFLRTVSDFSVSGPFAAALRATWAGHAPELLHVAVMAAGLLVFGGLAVRFFRWE